MIDSYIKALVNYAVARSLIKEADRVYCVNGVLSLLKKNSFDASVPAADESLEKILDALCDYAAEDNIIENTGVYRDLFDTAIMGVFTPRPSEVILEFNALYKENPEKATDFYYAFSCNTNYIRRDRIAKDMKWTYDSDYGTLDITVNLSKPEKDPRDIAAAKNAPQSGYPKCQLCRESEGYAGRVNFPARQNHRVIPVTIANSDWFMQYSPYVYYNEHCIVFNGEHTPMKIDRSAFNKLLDFVKLFPHYFVGSNADLPIVGGSILSHEHFQGGHYDFAMAKAGTEYKFSVDGFPEVQAGILKWPMSVIRLVSSDSEKLTLLADKILRAWREYTDESVYIFAKTDDVPHNTITPIARMRNGKFELDLVLRNNITSEEHPLGVFHPHAELHHIKKENIGLIEVMGLAVLPKRLKNELQLLSEAILNNSDIRADNVLSIHADWVDEIKNRYSDINKDNIDVILKTEVGRVFATVLEHAGVFKHDAEGVKAFKRFIESIK